MVGNKINNTLGSQLIIESNLHRLQSQEVCDTSCEIQ